MLLGWELIFAGSGAIPGVTHLDAADDMSICKDVLRQSPRRINEPFSASAHVMHGNLGAAKLGVKEC